MHPLVVVVIVDWPRYLFVALVVLDTG